MIYPPLGVVVVCFFLIHVQISRLTHLFLKTNKAWIFFPVKIVSFLPSVCNSDQALSKLIVLCPVCGYAFLFSELLPVFLPSFPFGFHAF